MFEIHLVISGFVMSNSTIMRSFEYKYYDWDVDDGSGYDENGYGEFLGAICCTNGLALLMAIHPLS